MTVLEFVIVHLFTSMQSQVNRKKKSPNTIYKTGFKILSYRIMIHALKGICRLQKKEKTCTIVYLGLTGTLRGSVGLDHACKNKSSHTHSTVQSATCQSRPGLWLPLRLSGHAINRALPVTEQTARTNSPSAIMVQQMWTFSSISTRFCMITHTAVIMNHRCLEVYLLVYT